MIQPLIKSMIDNAKNRRIKAFDKFNAYVEYQPTDKEVYDFYHSPEWANVRKQVLIRDRNIDQTELMEHGRIIPGNTVHHIVELRNNWNARFELDNLETISPANHNREHIEKGNKQLESKKVKIDKLKLNTSIAAVERTPEL
jgi:5-methylcytosine-specific restriction endonuclease McrA